MTNHDCSATTTMIGEMAMTAKVMRLTCTKSSISRALRGPV